MCVTGSVFRRAGSDVMKMKSQNEEETNVMFSSFH